MRHVTALLAVGLLLLGAAASAQVPRTVLAEIASATW
jgi:hypothetical protein